MLFINTGEVLCSVQCAGEGWIVPPHEPFHTFETCPLIAQREKRLIQMRIGSKSNFVALTGRWKVLCSKREVDGTKRPLSTRIEIFIYLKKHFH